MSIMSMVDGDEEKIVIENETPQDIVVDISDDDEVSTSESEAAEAAAAAAAAAAKTPRTNKVPAKDRINTLTRQKNEEREGRERAESVAERLLRENAELRAGKAQSDRAAFENYAQKVDAQLADARRAVREALAEGDTDKIADAQEKLAPIATEKQNIDAFKKNREAAEQEEAKRPKPAAQPQAPERRAPQELSPEIKAFVAETPWFDADSDDYDAEMHQAAVAHAQVIESRYRRAGRVDEIGKSAQYFKDVREATEKDFDYGKPAAPAQGLGGKPPMAAGAPDVAPATRGDMTGSGRTNTRQITLSAEEVDVVRRNVNAGAVKDPKTGKTLTMDQAIKSYAKNKERFRLQDAQS